ncbi:MAG: twin-arginine translocase subunit TatC [Bdellovibrionia bacterium]
MMSELKSSRNMSFYEHFDELRVRLLRAFALFFLGFLVCYGFSEPILSFLRKPLFEVLPEAQRKLYFTSLFENFLTHLKISGYASVFLLSPYFFSEVWGFVAPGLYPREKKLAIPFVVAASVFFLGGAAFAYTVLFPVGFRYFVSYGASSDFPMLTIESYYGTCLKLLLLFGLAFELPVLICFLGILGVVDAQVLREHRRNAILFITILSALFAPPDAISMLILGVPLIFLYEASIFVVQWMGRGRVSSQGLQPGSTQQEEYDPFDGRSRT